MSSLPPLSQNRFRKLRKLIRRKYRYQENSFLCEGIRIFRSAQSGRESVIRDILCSRSFSGSDYFEEVMTYGSRNGIPVYLASDQQINELSSDQTPSGLIFRAAPLPVQTGLPEGPDLPVYLFLDHISEPGNLGTIIRTAGWFGFDVIMMRDGSVDPFHPRCIRASAGAVFKTVIHQEISLDQLNSFCRQRRYHLIATHPTQGIPLAGWKLSTKSIILLGSEAHGLDHSLLDIAGETVTIPASGGVESLNIATAAGIVLYEIRRQLSATE